MEEEWRDVVEFEDYYMVSNLGRIMSKPRLCLGRAGKYRKYKGKILNTSLNAHGYLRITISVDGKHYYKTVHRIVAAAFLGLDYNSKMCVDIS